MWTARNFKESENGSVVIEIWSFEVSMICTVAEALQQVIPWNVWGTRMVPPWTMSQPSTTWWFTSTQPSTRWGLRQPSKYQTKYQVQSWRNLKYRPSTSEDPLFNRIHCRSLGLSEPQIFACIILSRQVGKVLGPQDHCIEGVSVEIKNSWWRCSEPG